MYGETDAKASLAFDSTGKATAVWVRQGGVHSAPAGDSPFNNNDLRHLVVATWNPNTDVWTTDAASVWNAHRCAHALRRALEDQGPPHVGLCALPA